MYQAHASEALAQALIEINPLSVTAAAGKPIEDLIVDMLKAGMIKEVRDAIIEAQRSWGTLPIGKAPQDKRFIPHINPFVRFLREGDYEFLKSVKNEFFGLTGAGLTLDIPEKRYQVDKYFRYRYTLPLDAAVEFYGKDFAAFECATKTQLSHFCRLFADNSGTRRDVYGFTRDLDFDYKNFLIWGGASELNYYALRDNLAISAGMGKGFVTSDIRHLTTEPDPRLVRRQQVLWKALNHREEGVAVLNSIVRLNSDAYHRGKPISRASGAKFYWELMPRIADVLSQNLGVDRSQAIKTLLLKGLQFHFGGQDHGFEASTTQWVELDKVLPLIRAQDREAVTRRLEGAGDNLENQLAELLEDELGL
jgi:hypothetical protein